MKALSDWDIKDLDHATKHAAELTIATGDQWIPIDHGKWVAPQYSVAKMPVIGEDVSYGFNGDYYPDGKIVKVSKTLKVITTSSGKRYYRKRQTNTWLNNKTWALVDGIHDERNPHI